MESLAFPYHREGLFLSKAVEKTTVDNGDKSVNNFIYGTFGCVRIKLWISGEVCV